MHHYCEECKRNNHCLKCCPLLKDVTLFECRHCRETGTHPSSCCMKGGDLRFCEKRYQEKRMNRMHMDSDEEKDKNARGWMHD